MLAANNFDFANGWCVWMDEMVPYISCAGRRIHVIPGNSSREKCFLLYS